MKNNQLQHFQSEEFGSLDVLMIEGKPFFPAKECTKILGYKDTTNAIKQHCRSVVKHHIPHPQSPSKTIQVNFIPEGDLYRLIIRSKLPSAARFEAWVFNSVLPDIRQYGAYVTDETLDKILESPVFAQRFFRVIAEERQKNAALLDKLEDVAPKARYYDLILQSNNAIQVSIIAKDYGLSAVAFNRLLHYLGIQYKIGGTWLLYQRFADKGYTQSRTYYAGDGTAIISTWWTQKGRFFLYDTLLHEGIVPLMKSEHPNI